MSKNSTLLCPTGLYASEYKNFHKLLLGNWCFNSKKKIKKNFTICSYPWDNKKILSSDYNYILRIKKKILLKLATYLNDYHSINESADYWKIIIGPWVTIFCQTLLERWRNFCHVQKNYSFKYVVNSNKNFTDFVPRNFEEFIRHTSTDNWNQYIYEDIFKFYLNKNFFITRNHKKITVNKPNKIPFKRIVFDIINNFISHIFFYKKKKFFICESYLGKIEEFKLNFILGYPSITLSPVYPDIKVNLNHKKRNERIFTKNEISDDLFLRFLNNVLLKNIPTSFLEEFFHIKKFVKNLNWPEKPKVFFTSHCLVVKTICSFYLAEKKKIGCKLIHGQHGGYYGTALFNTIEDLELDIADKYLSWGWTRAGKYKKKIIKFGILKKKLNLLKGKKNFFLFVLKSQSRFTNKIHSGAGHNNLLRYYNDCENFLNNLNRKIKRNIILRRHARLLDWPEEEKISQMFKKNQVDNGELNLLDLINKSIIVIHTYNSTGFLESLAANKPTILFWNINDYPINRYSKKYFDYLREANILYYNWKDAVSFLNKNYLSIDCWWESKRTQYAKDQFCANFAKINNSKLNNLIEIFKSI